MEMTVRRLAVREIPEIAELIAASVRVLQAGEYTEAQREAAVGTVFSVDSRLVRDGGYFGVFDGERLVGCGGWSGRRTLYGGDHQLEERAGEWMDPEVEAAKIRAIFVRPGWERRGIGRMLVRRAEEAARAAGFCRFEMGSTLTGLGLYEREGYVEVGRVQVPVGGGERIEVVRMVKGAGEV